MGIGNVDNYILAEATSETRAVIRKYRSCSSNEVLAALAWEAFSDYADGIPGAKEAFNKAFPTSGLFI